MRKRIITILMAFVMSMSFIPIIGNQGYVFATQSMGGNFSKSYSLTGNGAADIVAVAQAQENRSQSSLGYTEGWCADFVSDCARLAGQESAVPFNGGVSALYNAIINAGGTSVTSPQKGDICFFDYAHVGIMVDSINCISGNMNNSYVQTYTYTGINVGSTKRFLRPRYSAPPPAPNNAINCTTVFPEKAPVGTAINLTGTITSDYNVGSVVMQLYRGGDLYRSYDSGIISTKSFDISQVNSKLNLSNLPAGWYTLNIAMANDVSRATASFAFKLYDPTNNKIILDEEIPACFETGADVSIAGRATTRYTVGSVIANVTDVNQNKRIYSYDSGLISVKTLEFTAMAQAIDLSKLAPGKYRLTIAMSNNPDESVAAERIERKIDFVVVPKNANSINLTYNVDLENVVKGTDIKFGGSANSIYTVGSVIAQLSDSNKNIVASYDSGLIRQESFPLSELNPSIKTNNLDAGRYKLVIAMSSNPSGYVPAYRISKVYYINITDKHENTDNPSTPMEPTNTSGTTKPSAAVIEKAIMTAVTDEGPAGTEFGILKLKSNKQTNSSITLNWSLVNSAVKYVIYGNKCGTANKMKKLDTVSGKALTINNVLGEKVKKGTYYKFIVVALDKNNNVISTSKVIHVATKGGKVGNFKKIMTAAKKNKVNLKAGKKFKLKTKGVKGKGKVKKHRAICYESSNPAVATVSKKGIIKGVAPGQCIVYAYAQNGVFTKVKVSIK